jgi:hypothetical protein
MPFMRIKYVIFEHTTQTLTGVLSIPDPISALSIPKKFGPQLSRRIPPVVPLTEAVNDSGAHGKEWYLG